MEISNEEEIDYNTLFDFDFSVKAIVGQKKSWQDDLLFVLHIPRINLIENVYNIYSSKNNVDYHVQILNGSDVSDNLLFLAGHSGTGVASYFNRLVELEVGDVIWIDKGDEKKYFVVESLFYISKDGYLEYSFEEYSGVLYLITCSLEYVDKQLVVKANVVY